MKRRWLLSLILLLVLAPLRAKAGDPVAEAQEFHPDFELFETVRLGFGTPRYASATYDLVDLVTMRQLPPGSLYTEFDGVQGVVVKHLRSQYRGFTRRAARAGWMTQQDGDPPLRALYERLDHTPVDSRSNGEWWQRTWQESLSEEHGGAPRKPYIHTYGREIAWGLGPLTLTNTAKVRFNYFASLELNPEPVSHDHLNGPPRVALDVQPAHGVTIGTDLRVGFKPRLRIGMPDSDNVLSALKGVSIQASFELWHNQSKVVEGEAEIKWRPDEGLLLSVELALASW